MCELEEIGWGIEFSWQKTRYGSVVVQFTTFYKRRGKLHTERMFNSLETLKLCSPTQQVIHSYLKTSILFGSKAGVPSLLFYISFFPAMLWFNTSFYFWRSRGSSVSTVSDYGLEDQAIGFRCPAGAKNYPLASMSRQALGSTQPPVHWVPGGEVLSPGLKRGRRVTLATHPHLVPRSRMRSYTTFPPKRLHAV
jgi:hypothetical protein